MFGWAEMLILSWTRVIKSGPTVDQVHVRPNPVSHELLQSSPSLSECCSEGRNVHMTYARSSPDLKDHPPTPTAPASVCVCTLPVSQCHVLPSRIVTMCPGSALLHVPDPCYCHIVSAWLKRACVPQLSETELDFDFRNHVASVRHSPLTQGLTGQECPGVLPCATAIMRWKDSQIFTHAVAI